MRSDNGSLLLNFTLAAVLIVLGFVSEPMLGILGALIIVTSVAAQVVEELRRKKQMKQELEWRALYGENIPYFSPTLVK